MKPICVPCERFYRPKKNGTFFIEGIPINGNPKPGLAEPEGWQPYKLWSGDLWHCPDCGHQIIVGTGRDPVSERFMADFAEVVEKTEATKLIVKDC